ncbi:MAG: hypothetical protein ACI8W0_001420, partial [Flavobacterium sp.]
DAIQIKWDIYFSVVLTLSIILLKATRGIPI